MRSRCDPGRISSDFRSTCAGQMCDPVRARPQDGFVTASKRPLDSFPRVKGSFESGLKLRLLGLPEDLGDLVVGNCDVKRTLGATCTSELGGLVEQAVEIRVLLEVRCLEVVSPEHP